MDNLHRPNKTYVAEYRREVGHLGKFKRTVVLVADSEATARKYLVDTVGSEPDDLEWLMDCNYKVIFNQTGNQALAVQAKILYSTSVNYD